MAKEVQIADVVVTETPVPSITITPNDLRDVFLQWEIQARLAGTANGDGIDVEEVAEVNAALFWNALVTGQFGS